MLRNDEQDDYLTYDLSLSVDGRADQDGTALDDAFNVLSQTEHPRSPTDHIQDDDSLRNPDDGFFADSVTLNRHLLLAMHLCLSAVRSSMS